MMRNREARHATKAALAGLRSGSIRSAGCRHGYDCTARIEHLSQPASPSFASKLGTKLETHHGVAAFQPRVGRGLQWMLNNIDNWAGRSDRARRGGKRSNRASD